MSAFYRALLTRQEDGEADVDSSDDSSEDDVEPSDDEDNVGAILLDTMSDVEVEFED